MNHHQAHKEDAATIKRLYDEIERLRAEVERLKAAGVPADCGMTVIDLSDDDALRFACRVLEGGATELDTAHARQILSEIRTRLRSAAPQPPTARDISELRAKMAPEVLKESERIASKMLDEVAKEAFK